MNLRGIRLATAVAAFGVIAACGTSQTSETNDAPREPAGFDRQVMRVSTVDSAGGIESIDRCVWVADTSDERRRGLMGVTTLGAADGMLFVQEQPTSGAFWMKDTLIDLSIAFFDQDGEFLDAMNMSPCLATNGNDCPRYQTPSSYVFALEVAQGDLAELGIHSTSIISLVDQTCSSSTARE